MSDPDTLSFYRKNAGDLGRTYADAGQPMAEFFPMAFPSGARVLDVGAGTGRDVEALLEAGYDAIGLEPVAEMRSQAAEYHPTAAGRIHDGGLLMGSGYWPHGQFDGILCSAVLQHFPRSKLLGAVFELLRALTPGGRLLLSIPVLSEGASERAEDGRLFSRLHPVELRLLFERAGFTAQGEWKRPDALGRNDRTWVTMLFARLDQDQGRALDRIEAVLSQDRKTATYKFALLRALCEIAMERPRIVQWRDDDHVGVPIEAIGELWIEYYWPLLDPAAPQFLPQYQAERAGKPRKVGFGRELEVLIKHFSPIGGLSTYVADRQAGALGTAAALRSGALRKLRTVIREGPVKHAGGWSTPLFDSAGGLVLVQHDLWRELSLMGSWIADALVLRWAAQVSAFSRGEVGSDAAVHALLTRPDLDRDTALARRVFATVEPRTCVWSDIPIRHFEVDHAIPHTVRRRNELWNLFPAHPRMNNKKRDSLPSTALLEARRPKILDYWRAMQQSPHAQRFDAEAGELAGTNRPGIDLLFDCFLETIELTATQRGCGRWEPT